MHIMNTDRLRSFRRKSAGRQWNRQARVEMLETRQLLAADAQFASVRLVATDLNGNQVNEVAQGETFLIKVLVEDRRGDAGAPTPTTEDNFTPLPRGFASFFMNLAYNRDGFDFKEGSALMVGPTVTTFDTFVPDDTIDGYLTHIGFVNTRVTSQTFPNEIEYMSFRMVAEATGTYGFTPELNTRVVATDDDPNIAPEDRGPEFLNGYPVTREMTNNERVLFEDKAEYISLIGRDDILDTTAEVYFQGLNLTVTAATPEVDFEVRFVTTPSQTLPTSRGEIDTPVSNTEIIDEWSHVYVELYAQAEVGTSITGGVYQIAYDPTEFAYVGVIDTSDDVTNVKYTNTITTVDSTNGLITVSFNTLRSDLGDDNFALLGRVQLRSLIEIDIDDSQGNYQPVTSSSISLVDANATISTQGVKSIVVGNLNDASQNFEVWPVIFDLGDGGDRKIGVIDFSQLVQQMGRPLNEYPDAVTFDFNRDGKVGVADLNILVQNFGVKATDPSPRNYPTWYTDLMFGTSSSSFAFEGESTGSEQTTSTSSTTSGKQSNTSGSSDSVSGSGISSSKSNTFLIPSASTSSSGSSTTTPSEEGSETMNPDSTDQIVSDWNDQSDVIIAASSSGSDTTVGEEDDSSFANDTDTILALWDDETDL
ncbi:hypothetical protein [Bremerella cremea]|uniref:hypothetical protein n=1 Tax=Bremerella cremea TaxID=1031537 RepID=UPI0031EE2FE6